MFYLGVQKDNVRVFDENNFTHIEPLIIVVLTKIMYKSIISNRIHLTRFILDLTIISGKFGPLVAIDRLARWSGGYTE